MQPTQPQTPQVQQHDKIMYRPPLNQKQSEINESVEKLFEQVNLTTYRQVVSVFEAKSIKISTNKVHDINPNIIETQETDECSQIKEQQPIISKMTNNNNGLKILPKELILNIFEKLSLQGMHNLGVTDKTNLAIFQEPVLLTSLLEAKKIPNDKVLEIAKKAGSLLNNLNLDMTDITLTQFEDLVKFCPNIQVLDLKNCEKVTSDFLATLPSNLKSLRFSGLDLTGEGVLFIFKLDKLAFLDMHACTIDQKAYFYLSSLPENLKTVNKNDSLFKIS